MYLSGISVRKIVAGVTDASSKVRIGGKDAASRIAERLQEEQRAWRERPLLKGKAYPYLYPDATSYPKVRRGASVTNPALPARTGVDEEGFGEVLAVEVAGPEKGAAYAASLLRGLIDRGLKGVRPVVSDDHEGIKAAVAGELPGADRQRCVVHYFERNVLSHVPASSMGEVAEDPKAIFEVRREKTARALAEEFVSLHGRRFPKAVSVFEAGIEDALTYLRYPGSHHHSRVHELRTCWSGSLRRLRSGRGWWWASSPTRRVRAPRRRR